MIIRYSDAELEEFRVLVEDKLVKAKAQLDDLQSQIVEVTESSEDGFGTDWIEDSSVGSQIDFLNEMVSRQRKYIDQLENALLRIGNKIYGICSVTGELIDKRRLLAVPTTTKSVTAKTATPEKKPRPVRPTVTPSEPIIITKVVKKDNKNASKDKKAALLDEEDDDFVLDDKIIDDDEFDFDNFASDGGDDDGDSYDDPPTDDDDEMNI